MKRVLVKQLGAVGDRLPIPREEAHHLTRVRRVDEGTELEALDGQGRGVRGELIVEGKQAFIQITAQIEEDRESPYDVRLVLGIPSSRNTLDGFLPGLVQLGVKQIHIVPGDYGGRIKGSSAKYQARLQQIVLQSLKQCGRLTPPTLHFPKDWSAALATCCRVGGAHRLCHPDPHHHTSFPARTTGEPAFFYIGPEGGFSDEEVTQAKQQGIACLDLGPRILKMETAATAIAARYLLA